MTTYDKPLPIPSPETQPYWDACKRHELRIQQCVNCGRLRHYPQMLCPYCYSFEYEWTKVSGRGKVYDWVVCHQAFQRGFIKDVPFAIAIIELDEGVRMISRLVDVKPEQLTIGMPVTVVFEDVTDAITLPMFQPLPETKR